VKLKLPVVELGLLFLFAHRVAGWSLLVCLAVCVLWLGCFYSVALWIRRRRWLCGPFRWEYSDTLGASHAEVAAVRRWETGR